MNLVSAADHLEGDGRQRARRHASYGPARLAVLGPRPALHEGVDDQVPLEAGFDLLGIDAELDGQAARLDPIDALQYE